MEPCEDLDAAFFSKSNKATKEILYDGNLYDVSTFLYRHPGGHEILLNFTGAGEDATLAVQQFHRNSIDKVLKLMNTLPKRSQPQVALSEEMKQVRQKNAEMTTDFVNLYAEMKEEGLFEPSLPHWIYRFVGLIALGFLGFSLITHSSTVIGKLVGSFVLTMAIGQGGWIMHEFGHLSVTGNPNVDRFMHDVVLGLCLGTSGIWWRRHHNVHHAMTNRLDTDPDIDALPGLLVCNPKILHDPRQDQTFFERNQIYFAPLYAILASYRWNYWFTPIYLYKKRRIVEIISISCHYFLMYQIGFTMWFTTATLYGLYVFLNLFLNHTYAPVTVTPTHWIEQGFVNTVNVAPGSFSDWWMGYLNYQIEHHLFPTLPQFRFPLIVDRVKALAQKHGLPYQADSYFTTCRKAFGNINGISQFLKSVH